MNNNQICNLLASDKTETTLNTAFQDALTRLCINHDVFAEKTREYFKKKFSFMSDLEIAQAVTQFLLLDMSFDVFVEAMKILDCRVFLKVLPPETIVVAETLQPEQALVKETPTNLFYSKNVDELDMPIRVTNILKANNVYQFGELVALTEQDVRRFINMGRVGMEHLKSAMREHGLEFGKVSSTWVSDRAQKSVVPPEPNKPVIDVLLNDRIKHWPFSNRVHNVLAHNEIVYIGQLVELSAPKIAELDRAHHIENLANISQVLAKNDLKLGMKLEGWAPPLNPILDLAVEYLHVEVAILNALHAYGITQIGQIIALGRNEISKLPGIGKTRLLRLIKALSNRSLTFGTSLGGWKPN